jgi:hypothetical protein
MWLVVCPAADLSALWAYRGLRARGLEPLELVAAEVLAHALRWDHRLGTTGTTIEIELADGRRISGDQVRGTLNRLVHVPADGVVAAHSDDRDFAAQELNALYLSWLSALPGPMLNRPTPQGLCGAWRHLSEWTWLAARAGLTVAPCRLDSADPHSSSGAASTAGSRQAIVVAGRVCGPALPPAAEAGSRRLAALAETPLLGVDFAATADGQWTFVGATPVPDLRRGGEALLAALAATFEGDAESQA